MPPGMKGFAWDDGNRDKNELKHGVTGIECEDIFFNKPLIVARDPRHSVHEPRFTALGRTRATRLIFVAFTVRRERIRVISARPMSRKERLIYEKEIRA